MVEHRLAQLTAAATFVLLVIGGTVNPTGSSLACPEPTFVCNGELFPPMVGGVFYEHGHRLAAMTVGLLQLALTFFLWSRRRSRLLAVGLLGMVLLQGALGAITVQYKLPWFISTAHLLLGMSYFGVLVYTAFRTRPAPSVVELQQHDHLRGDLGNARTWIAIAIGAVFVQLLLGALVRHLGAAMVCFGMPACTLSGEWLPDTGVQQLHMLHRAFGVVTAVITTSAAVVIARRAQSWVGLRILALSAPVLVALQIVLGVLTIRSMREVPLAVGHFAGAVSLWAVWLSMWLLTAKRSQGADTKTRLGRL